MKIVSLLDKRNQKSANAQKLKTTQRELIKRHKKEQLEYMTVIKVSERKSTSKVKLTATRQEERLQK